MASDKISRLKRSITWYKEFVEIFNSSQLGQPDGLSAEVQLQENSNHRLCEFLNNKVLQQDLDKTSRDSRISFVLNLCDYLATMSYYQIVMRISCLCKTYQAGLKGDYSLSICRFCFRGVFCSSITAMWPFSFWGGTEVGTRA